MQLASSTYVTVFLLVFIVILIGVLLYPVLKGDEHPKDRRNTQRTDRRNNGRDNR